jgi:heme/copper-type cytochrome/quinol oxidase subunit 4
MWNHYKKSFLFIQLLVLLVTFFVYQGAEHRLAVAAFFFLIMQLSSVIGSMWAMRLRRKLEQRPW